MTVTGSYDPLLVTLSVALAIVASFAALDLAGRIRAAAGATRLAWLATAALAMGGGIWAMHFVAILAWRLPMAVTYDPWRTALSLVLAVLVTGAGFAVAGGAKDQRWVGRLALGGTLMGAGIAVMHYTGMAAMRMPGDMSEDPVFLVASVLVAVAASTGALWLAARERGGVARLPAAFCLGLAVSAMHYTAMLGLTISTPGMAPAARARPHADALAAGLGQAGLALGVAMATGLILSLALLASAFDRRLAAAAEREATALRRSEERFRTLYHSTPLPLHSLDADGRILQVSDSWLELLGYARDEVIGQKLGRFLMSGGPDGAGQDGMERACHAAERRVITRDGRVLAVLLSARALPDGLTLGGMVDVTAQREAEEALRHAQKMEAVGQLTGGVAHDFNNLLTAILSSLELLERRVANGEQARQWLDVARQAVRRGTQLTQSLLAFSRRQPLRPEPTDANALLQESATLIRRALGETVALELGFGDRLPHCRVDAAQLQAAVLNLVINARDAMPQGGAVTIRTARATLDPGDLAGNDDARPGEFVAVSVCDTGTGMSAQVLARAFEPFFTTKEAGRGTGLGLSQVYGFARQSGGHVTIDSTPGQGTAVTIYLPALPGGEWAASATAAPPVAAPSAVTETTVLMVEDEEAVREATAEVLREDGWRVLTARNAAEALAVLRAGAAVDVLFTDVVMPGGMSGVELARAARALRPDIGVLLASGYTGIGLGMDGAGFELLAKPYDRSLLLTRLAAAPSRPPAVTGAA